MKANELRIGNYFIDVKGATYGAKKNSIQVVHSIKGDGVNEWKEMGFNPVNCKFTDMEPIPITEEWLERFGAKSDDLEIDSYVLSSLTCDYRFFKTELIGGDIYWTCEKVLGDTCIEYVHQLQNLYYALTGEELKLNER